MKSRTVEHLSRLQSSQERQIIINEMATISIPQAEEYDFPFKELPTAPLLEVDKIIDNFEEYEEITASTQRITVMFWLHH